MAASNTTKIHSYKQKQASYILQKCFINVAKFVQLVMRKCSMFGVIELIKHGLGRIMMRGPASLSCFVDYLYFFFFFLKAALKVCNTKLDKVKTI